MPDELHAPSATGTGLDTERIRRRSVLNGLINEHTPSLWVPMRPIWRGAVCGPAAPACARRGLPITRHSVRLSAKDRCKALAVGPRGLAAFNRAAASGIHNR